VKKYLKHAAPVLIGFAGGVAFVALSNAGATVASKLRRAIKGTAA
jgi:hypothetical protein